MNIDEYSQTRSRSEYSSIFTELEANNCLSIIFRGEYQELQNNILKHKTQMQLSVMCLQVCSRSFNDTLTCTSMGYLCFIVVVFIHSCHHRLKMSTFGLKKNKFRSIDLNCWRSTQPLRLSLKVLEKSLGVLRSKNADVFEYALWSTPCSWREK